MIANFAIKRCKNIIKKHSHTFYKAFSMLEDKKKRHAIYAVYAFCRYADDLVDEFEDEEKLKHLEDELTLFRKGKHINHYRWIALDKAARPFYEKNYEYRPFFEMIKGQRMDLNHQGYETLDELLSYCYYVASTVGLMLIPILSPIHSADLEQFAINLGYGMQLTNILRDIGEDYNIGRIYLPKDLMEKANYKKEDLAHGIINIEFINLFESLATLAEKCFESALSQIELFPKDVRDPLALSIMLYRAIIDACRDNKYQVFTHKNYVSDETKHRLITSYLESIKGEKA